MEAYGVSLAGLAVLTIMTLIMAPLAAMKKAKAGLLPGQEPPADFNSAAYRWDRIHANSVEALVTMSVATFLAIFAGISVWVVAVLVWVHVAARVGFWGVYAVNVGKPAGGLRSILFVVGRAMTLILAIAALGAAVF